VTPVWRTIGRVAATGTVLSLGVWLLQTRGVLPHTDDDDPTGPPGEDVDTDAAEETGSSPTTWPSPATTGADEDTALGEWSGSCTLSTPGQVVEDVVLRCGVVITAPGVVVRNAVVQAPGDVGIDVQVDEGAAAVIEDVTVEAADSCRPDGVALQRTNYHARRVEVQGFGQAFRFAGDNTVVEDSYAKVCSAGELRYAEGAVTGFEARNATPERPNRFSGNTVDQRCQAWTFPADQDPPLHPGSGDDNDQACDLAPLVFWIDAGDGFALTDNLLRGGAYTIDLGSGGGHEVQGNVVERAAYAYEPVFTCTGVADWSENWLADVDRAGDVDNRSALPCPETG
jgi:hypothetical protein